MRFSTKAKILRPRGFTLIELLVVIAIIGLLSSVVLASLNTARSKARDAARLAALHQVAIALELYRSSAGAYPAYAGSPATLRENSCFTGGGSGDAIAQWSTALAPLVTSGYISALPKDPLNNGASGGNSQYCYGYHISPVGEAHNTFDGCVDSSNSNTILYPGDYEYFLYFSVENPSSAKYTLQWNGLANKPENACLPGPRR